MPKVRAQENRFTDIWVDQYGREYLVNCERSTGDPVDMSVHLWKAPLSPAWAIGLFTPPTDDHDIVRLVPRIERSRKGYQVFVDHEAWIRKNATLQLSYDERVASLAKESGGKVSQELLRYVGAPPFPPRDFLQAMLAGNEWALGLSDKVPDKALAMLEQIKPAVLALHSNRITERDDPFADESDDEAAFEMGARGPREIDPLAVEEAFDPDATGGQRVAVGRRGKRKPAAIAADPE